MNNELFKLKLSQVADWHIPKVKLDGVERRKLRGRPTKQDQEEELANPEFAEVNPTAPPEILKVKSQPVDCQDCGQHCPNGRECESKFFFTHQPHWRKRCITCGLNQNPYTGEFDLKSKDASGVWNLYLRKIPVHRFTKTHEENQDS